ncbi:hypothetical protein [Aureimonas sp. SK2]|uniref:hypothetical protein n=1 Tax=Aureimonas sp. SK2 TaxID=3015992 RepID=UPI002443A457|nr:hypothetical protein [Aureimonas sp. SK2]
MADKVQENRIRRMAERQGMQLKKIRRIDPKAIDYGHFTLSDREGKPVLIAGQATGTADQVEAFLKA